MKKMPLKLTPSLLHVSALAATLALVNPAFAEQNQQTGQPGMQGQHTQQSQPGQTNSAPPTTRDMPTTGNGAATGAQRNQDATDGSMGGSVRDENDMGMMRQERDEGGMDIGTDDEDDMQNRGATGTDY